MTTSWQHEEVTLVGSVRGTDLALAERFGIATAAAEDPDRWHLIRSADRITLRAPRACQSLALTPSLHEGPLARRLRTVRRSDELPRACGLHRPGAQPRIVDATAGLGRDAMVLASLGCEVTAIERLPALAFLLADLVHGAPWQDHLTVVAADAAAWLAQQPAPVADVVYLDPMFATGGKAQVKKDMQVCRLLAGDPDDPTALFAAARAAASERVVVKRHHGSPPLAPAPSFAIAGERVRFDVYLAAPR